MTPESKLDLLVKEIVSYATSNKAYHDQDAEKETKRLILDFMKGQELKWISVSDRLPESCVNVLCESKEPCVQQWKYSVHNWMAHTNQDAKWFIEKFERWKAI